MLLKDGETRPIRIGVLGAANIARAFIAGVAPSSNVEVPAVASRNLERARTFVAELGIMRAFGSYEALLADPDIDAVYNPLPNSLHAEWSIKALKAGKHVLCEKPLATTAAEARDMYVAAREAGRLLAEAYPYRAQPQTIEMLRLIASRELGRPRMIQAAFGFTMQDAANIRLDPTLGGGALMDAGSYPISLVRMLSGALPVAVNASALWSESGVDTGLIANLDFADGLLAQVACTFSTGVHRHAVIGCEKGAIMTSFSNHTGPDMPAVLHVKRGTGWTERFEPMHLPTTNGFLAEAETFAAALRGGFPWNGISEVESVDVAVMLEQIQQIVSVQPRQS